MKNKESLEESAKRTEFERYGENLTTYTKERPAYKLGFHNGSEWQKEQMYSEEEVVDLLEKMNSWPTMCADRDDVIDWFELYKKK